EEGASRHPVARKASHRPQGESCPLFTPSATPSLPGRDRRGSPTASEHAKRHEGGAGYHLQRPGAPEATLWPLLEAPAGPQGPNASVGLVHGRTSRSVIHPAGTGQNRAAFRSGSCQEPLHGARRSVVGMTTTEDKSTKLTTLLQERPPFIPESAEAMTMLVE